MRIDDLLNILIYSIIPLLAVVIIFFVKMKLLWAAPLISTALAGITYMIAFSVNRIGVSELLGNSEWRAFFLLAMLIQLVITIAFTAAAYFIVYILERKRKQTNY